MRDINAPVIFAAENKDGSYSIPGTDHKNLTPQELEKLEAILPANHWVLFKDYSNNKEHEQRD